MLETLFLKQVNVFVADDEGLRRNAITGSDDLRRHARLIALPQLEMPVRLPLFAVSPEAATSEDRESQPRDNRTRQHELVSGIFCPCPRRIKIFSSLPFDLGHDGGRQDRGGAR